MVLPWVAVPCSDVKGWDKAVREMLTGIPQDHSIQHRGQMARECPASGGCPNDSFDSSHPTHRRRVPTPICGLWEDQHPGLRFLRIPLLCSTCLKAPKEFPLLSQLSWLLQFSPNPRRLSPFSQLLPAPTHQAQLDIRQIQLGGPS